MPRRAIVSCIDPECGTPLRVTHVQRRTDGSTRRLYRCPKCAARSSTVEVPEAEYDLHRTAFDQIEHIKAKLRVTFKL